jgi:hypothetical protein
MYGIRTDIWQKIGYPGSPVTGGSAGGLEPHGRPDFWPDFLIGGNPFYKFPVIPGVFDFSSY